MGRVSRSPYYKKLMRLFREAYGVEPHQHVFKFPTTDGETPLPESAVGHCHFGARIRQGD